MSKTSTRAILHIGITAEERRAVEIAANTERRTVASYSRHVIANDLKARGLLREIMSDDGSVEQTVVMVAEG